MSSSWAEDGRETAVTDAWIQLRCPLPPWPEGAFAGPFGPEAACCLSLLSRRPQGTARDAGVEFRLLKAGEKGASAYEAACRQLHRDWARRLARGQTLPRISLRYFGAAEDAETF